MWHYYIIWYYIKIHLLFFFVFVLVAENKKVSCNKSHLAKNNIKINCLYSMLLHHLIKCLKGHMVRFQVFLSLWSVTSWLCIDKIPEVAKTKVSKPKRYSLFKVKTLPSPLKWLIQTHPHMSTSRCGRFSKHRPNVLRKKEAWLLFLL